MCIMIQILYKVKPNIYQTQLSDFLGLKTIEIYKMWEPSVYNTVRKKFSWVPVRRFKKRASNNPLNNLPCGQKRIVDFVKWVPDLKENYIDRFPKVKIPRYEEFAKGRISKKEWDMHRYLPGFNGFLENLCEFNDISYFDDLQERLEANGVSFKNMFVKDVILYELFRINNGFKNYAALEKMSRFMAIPPLFSVTNNPCFMPTGADVSYAMKRIPAKAIFDYFQVLVRECVDLGIIVTRFLIWDGQFIRSNSNNNKNKKKNAYSDLDAGYSRHNGTKRGVGYDPGILYAYCGDRWLPVYFEMFPGNRSDQEAFKETVNNFLTVFEFEWQMILSDSGPYSFSNMENVRLKGMVPIIRSRKNVKTQPVKELKEGYFFNTEFIPKEWSNDLFLKLYAIRPMIEQGNSFNNTYYNASRMNTRGSEAAIKQRALLYIIILLKALTAYKLGRPDLIMKPSAFEPSKYLNFRLVMPRLAQHGGFQIFKDNWL